MDFSLSYRHAHPVNDSYISASRAFTQNVFAGGINLRPARTVAFSFSASSADYSDGNTRRSALASVAWYLKLPASPVLKLEYEWLDYDRHTPTIPRRKTMRDSAPCWKHAAHQRVAQPRNSR